MRISDLSSDVCSSDLIERNCIRRQVVLDRRCLLPQVQAGRCQLPCPGYIPADTAIPDDRVHSQQLSRWSLARRIIVRHALWRQERGALCKHILRVGPPFVRPFGPYAECWLSLYLGRAFGVQQRSNRSEEHTSELQSLMRISYAVFCLKKKNKY